MSLNQWKSEKKEKRRGASQGPSWTIRKGSVICFSSGFSMLFFLPSKDFYHLSLALFLSLSLSTFFPSFFLSFVVIWFLGFSSPQGFLHLFYMHFHGCNLLSYNFLMVFCRRRFNDLLLQTPTITIVLLLLLLSILSPIKIQFLWFYGFLNVHDIRW